MSDDATVEAAAIAYANAWAADIKQYLGKDVPTWDAMGPNQREAMRRVSSTALREAIQAEREGALAEIQERRLTHKRNEWNRGYEAALDDIQSAIRSRK